MAKRTRSVKRKRKVKRAARRVRRRVPEPSRAVKAPTPRAVETALAGIAHDIRTPLTGILALAELLASSDLGERERGWANALKSGAEHLAALTTLIVDAVKADAAGLVLRHEPFSPRALAESVGQALSARAGNKGIAAEVFVSLELPAMVLGDALRLRAALENLCDNAVKFTDEGTVVFTAGIQPAENGDVTLVFTVADTGIGIDDREIKKLFRPFAQASETVSRRYGGAGLGLVFVKRIAAAMQGTLGVTTHPGRGTTFRLYVPVEPLDAKPPAGLDGARGAPARALTLLCAEDNPYGRVVMNTILRELGHRVDFVESGEAAVKAATRGGYDAVLMDVTLPGLDGIEATRRIRALPGAAGQVPIIGISGRSEAGDESAARAAGMNFYFTKPVSPGKLAEVLDGLCLDPSS
jgi:CheY-like chemotaxis protein/nitrogen-specific signal transduction histidine kinase